MKNMKKLVAALLVLTMVLAVTATAFAADITSNSYVKFKGSAYGYGKVTNNYGKDKKVCVRKGSTTWCVDADSKKDWALLVMPATSFKKLYEYMWFNKKYLKPTSSFGKLVFSSGGSGRSWQLTDELPLEDYPDIKNAQKKTWVKLKDSKRKTNIRKTASLQGKSLGVLKGHKKLKLHKDKVFAYDSLHVPFFKVWYEKSPTGYAWVSAEYVTLK